MPQILDLNEESRPTLLFVMKDENRTKVHVPTPSVALTKELRLKVTRSNEGHRPRNFKSGLCTRR